MEKRPQAIATCGLLLFLLSAGNYLSSMPVSFALSQALARAAIKSPCASCRDMVAPDMVSSSAFCSSISAPYLAMSDSLLEVARSGLPLASERSQNLPQRQRAEHLARERRERVHRDR